MRAIKRKGGIFEGGKVSIEIPDNGCGPLNEVDKRALNYGEKSAGGQKFHA